MDPYALVPGVHDNALVELRISRLPGSVSLILDMLDYESGKPMRLTFPDISWLSSNLLGDLISKEPCVADLMELPFDEVPELYAVHDHLHHFRLFLIGGSTVSLVSNPPVLS